MRERNPTQLKEAWVIFFLLGMVMLNYPFLQIFNKMTPIFGVPLLILYFFIGWPVSIGVIYFFTRTLEHPPAPKEEDDGDAGGGVPE